MLPQCYPDLKKNPQWYIYTKMRNLGKMTLKSGILFFLEMHEKSNSISDHRNKTLLLFVFYFIVEVNN